MTQVPQLKKLVWLACSAAIIAMPLFAAPARRHAAAPPYDVTITGIVSDATTLRPVASVEITVENFKTKATTNAEGKYSISARVGGLPVRLTAARSGYSPSTQTVTASAPTGTTLNFSLQSKPTGSVKDVAGNTVAIDADSFKFAYLIPFSGYASSDTANFCLADGTVSHPDRSEIAKIIGPAAPQSNAKCCSTQVLAVQVAYKDGHTATAFLSDSCIGNEVDVLARDHFSGQFVYFNLTNVAEVNLP